MDATLAWCLRGLLGASVFFKLAQSNTEDYIMPDLGRPQSTLMTLITVARAPLLCAQPAISPNVAACIIHQQAQRQLQAMLSHTGMTTQEEMPRIWLSYQQQIKSGETSRREDRAVTASGKMGLRTMEEERVGRTSPGYTLQLDCPKNF